MKYKDISLVKKTFEEKLSEELDLEQVEGPLFVSDASGINDKLSGEEPVRFSLQGEEGSFSVVHSLAKWKRKALTEYKFEDETGLFVRMSAIRREEVTSPIHSHFVDQWDWEKVIKKEHRTKEYLRKTVKQIVKSVSKTEKEVAKN